MVALVNNVLSELDCGAASRSRTRITFLQGMRNKPLYYGGMYH